METAKIEVVFICLLCFLESCCTTPVRRIVGGQVLEYGSWPFLVSMHFLLPHINYNTTKIKHVCGGSLINPQWVVTAAHCVDESIHNGSSNANNWKVVLGEHNQYLKDEGEQVLQISQIYSHPNFTEFPLNYDASPMSNDIALLRLSQPANLTRHVDIVNMYTGEDFPQSKECQVAGWGQVSHESSGYPMYVPLETTVFLVNNTDCKRRYKNIDFFAVDETVICAGNTKIGKTDACQSDSGGPLVCLSEDDNVKYLVGVVSAGMGCGLAEYPGLYTSISDFTDWINNAIANERVASVGESGAHNTTTGSGPDRHETTTTTSILQYILDWISF